MKTDVVFIGTAIMDSIIRGFDPEPVSVTGYRAESGTLSIGGEAVNGSIASARLGNAVAIMCPLGNDIAGDVIVSELTRNGVDTSRIVRSDEHPTPVTTMFVAGDGSRRSITNLAHSYNFHPETYPEKFADAKVVVLGSLFRAPFDDPEVIHSVVSAAKSEGALVFADTKLPNFTRLSLDDIADSLPMIDYITPNEDEAVYCTGEREPDRMADAFLERGVRNVIIKLGPRGCFYKNRDESIYLPAWDIEAVDATGAGDNFLAGFVSGIIRGLSDREALSFANACGAICTTAVGAGTALRNREQVEAFLREGKQLR